VSAFETNAPQRLAEHFIALTAVKFVQEIFEITGRRLFVPLQSKQPRDFVVVELVHFQRGLGNRIFPKFVQIIL
jgi:hypothetical protein